MSVLAMISKVASQRPWRASGPKRASAPRHLAIAGVSYCGSTLLARILGSLPEVSNIGESHWLTERRQDGRTVVADLEHEDYSLQVQCHSCGRNCKMLTREFRLQLQRDPSDWYRKIARQLGGRVLVSADKNLSNLKRHDPALHMDALVVFKSPAQACYSHLTKIEAKQGRAPTNADVRAYLDSWARAYAKFLDDFPNRGRRAFMSFERFCAAPRHHLKVICATFELPFEASVLEQIGSGQHCLGGNRRVNQWFRESTQVEIKTLAPPNLSDEQLAIVAGHEEANRIYDALCLHHDRVFSASAARPNQAGRAEAVAGPPLVDREILRLIEASLQRVGAQRGFNQEKLAAKRRCLRGATEDPRDLLRLRLERLRKTSDSLHAIRFFEHALANLDLDRYRAIQRQLLNPESIRLHGGYLKYLNLDHWLNQNLEIIIARGWHQMPSRRILDLGCGPSHFAYVCRYFGHEVLGTDLPPETRQQKHDTHIFDVLSHFFGAERRLFTIGAHEPLPRFDHRFDLVTALMARFDFFPDDTRWGETEWTFFLRDLAENVLTERGQLFMKLNRAGGAQAVLEFMARNGAVVDETRCTVFFGSMADFRQDR